jgi:type IV pilus assembly protein PilV
MKIIKQKGISLLEVLISVLVLSVGLLGLGGLQLYALKGSNDAHFRTVASFLAADLADRMRINPEGVAMAGYEISSAQSTTLCTTGIKQCQGTAQCSAPELATFDLYQIVCGVKNDSFSSLGMRNSLPAATLSVDCNGVSCDSNLQHTITLSWQETDNHDTDDETQTRTLVWGVLP